jgi:hypothetical protein
MREDAFPEPQGLVHLELLSEEQGEPSEAVVEGIDFESLQSLPSFGLQCLRGR